MDMLPIPWLIPWLMLIPDISITTVIDCLEQWPNAKGTRQENGEASSVQLGNIVVLDTMDDSAVEEEHERTKRW